MLRLRKRPMYSKDMERTIPLDMVIELAFGFISQKGTQFSMPTVEHVTNAILRSIRGCVRGETFRYLVEHGMTAEYVEQWLEKRKTV